MMTRTTMATCTTTEACCPSMSFQGRKKGEMLPSCFIYSVSFERGRRVVVVAFFRILTLSLYMMTVMS